MPAPALKMVRFSVAAVPSRQLWVLQAAVTYLEQVDPTLQQRGHTRIGLAGQLFPVTVSESIAAVLAALNISEA